MALDHSCQVQWHLHADREFDLALLREVLHYEPATGEFFWRVDRANKKAGEKAGGIGPNGYRTICVSYRKYYAHHLAFVLSGQDLPPPGAHVDHINGNQSDNRVANLRVVTPSKNGLNRTRLNKNNTSGTTGVYFDRKGHRWLAQIQVNGKQHCLGRFYSIEEAIAARAAAHARYCWGAA
jgi:hypothetical protein